MHRRIVMAALVGATGLVGTQALPAVGEVGPAPPQMASVSAGAPVPGLLTEYAPAMSDNGRLVCFPHTIPGGLEAVTCTVRGAGLTWGSQPWGTFQGTLRAPIGVSGDGSTVAIIDQNGGLNVCTGSLTFGCRLVPFGIGGAAPDNISSKVVGISADGRYVLLVTAATNVTPGDGNGDPDLVRVDTVTRAVVTLNITPGGALSPTGATGGALSRNGRYAAIVSQDSLVSGQAATTVKQVYLKDIVGGGIRQVSVSFSATNGEDWSGYPAVSDNGRYVGFSSYADNLVANDENNEHDLFLRDLDLGRTQRVNLGPNGEQLAAGIGDRWSEPRWLSADGRIVAFSTSDVLYGGRPPQGGVSTSALRQVVVHNTATGQIRIASASPAGAPGNADSSGISLTADGTRVVFATNASNLGPQSPGGAVLVRDMDNSYPVPSLRVTGGTVAPAAIQVDGSASSDVDGVITGHRWDFGDGTSAVGATAAHTYTAPGTYALRLTVTDDEGSEAVAQQQVVIAPPEVTISSTRAKVSWPLGVARGTITFTGSTEAPARTTFSLTGNGRRYTLGPRDVAAGRFSLSFRAPSSLMPGAYEVFAVPAGAGPTIAAAGRVVVRRPVFGIIGSARSVTEQGRPLRAVRPRGTRQLFAGFKVVLPPNRGVALQAFWTVPGLSRPVRDFDLKRRGGLLVAGLQTKRGLRSGDYVCVLKAGTQEIARVEFTILR